MKQGIIFIDGLPASGKTTYATYLYKQSRSDHPIHCALYLEETTQPLDPFRQAYLPTRELESIMEPLYTSYPDKKDVFMNWMKSHTYTLPEYTVLAYTMITEDIIQAFPEAIPFLFSLKKYDIGDGRAALDFYKNIHFLTYQCFLEQIWQEGMLCFSDGSLFHNQLFDLIGFYGLSLDELARYFDQLLSIIDGIPKEIHFIETTDFSSIISYAFSERSQWYSGFCHWCREAPYIHYYPKNSQDLIPVYQKLYQTEHFLIRTLGLPVTYIPRTIISSLQGSDLIL